MKKWCIATYLHKGSCSTLKREQSSLPVAHISNAPIFTPILPCSFYHPSPLTLPPYLPIGQQSINFLKYVLFCYFFLICDFINYKNAGSRKKNLKSFKIRITEITL